MSAWWWLVPCWLGFNLAVFCFGREPRLPGWVKKNNIIPFRPRKPKRAEAIARGPEQE